MGLLRLHLQLEVMHLMRLALCSQLVMTLAIIIMDEIIRISTSLIDIASDSFSVCNRSLEHLQFCSAVRKDVTIGTNSKHQPFSFHKDCHRQVKRKDRRFQESANTD